ncbi:MAG: GNAT family N-acetyltransferase [Anaerolineaceae bacterium]|nr:GNAT family N-acetyltransferase [Anaerolineaceae bacterium]
MTVIIRPSQPDIYFPQIAELLSIDNGEPVPVEELIEEEEEILPGDVRQHFIALDTNQQFVGYGRVERNRNEPKGYYHLIVLVAPQHRRMGIGSALYAQIDQFAQAQQATRLFAKVREKSSDCLPFAEQRGFVIRNQMFMSRIELTNFDASKFAGLIKTVEETGIRFTTLEAEGNTPQARRQLYQINRIASTDDPAATDTEFAPFADYEKTILDASWFQPAGQFIAFDGNRAVGLSAVSYFPEINCVWSMLTGVAPTHHGRKIAQALKLLTIQYAKEQGADYLNTVNDSLNEPMLAINRKLGFVRQEGLGSYGLVKELR